MNREEIKKLIRGTPATVPTPFDDKYQVDYAKLTDLTKWWVEQGLGTDVAPIKTSAAMGEGPDLNDEEWPAILRTVVNAAPRGTKVICALKTKNTLHTIEDAKRAADLGAIGLQIDLPIFHHSNQDDYVRYFTDISDKIDIGIMIYNTWWFGCEHLEPDTILRLKDAEHVTAIKWSAPQGKNYDDMTKFSGIFNVIDNSGQAVRAHKNGGRGYISATIAAYPKFDLEVWKLLEAKKYDEAQAMLDKYRTPWSEWAKKASAKSGGYRQIKGLMRAIGKPAGDPRPPTLPCSEEEVADLKKVLKGMGWIK